MKTPTKVTTISAVRQVSCGCSHTLALSEDGSTVWSFGSGDTGKLGHGDNTRYTSPKVRPLDWMNEERERERERERESFNQS